MSGEPATLAGPDLTRGIAADDVAEGQTLLGHADGEPVVMARCHGELFAVGAQCTHYGGPLHEGIVVGGTIRCPWHHAAFDLRTGAASRPPALNDLPCWKVEVRNGTAIVTGRRPASGAVANRSHATGGASVPESVLIIGGGAAGAVAAETLRREGYDGPVTILEAGPSGPVDRPNLSKDYLAGNAPEEWIPLRPDSFYTEHRIDLRLGKRVTAIDSSSRRVTLDDGTTLGYGALLLSTGAEPTRLEIPDPERRIHYLRTLADSRAIIDAASRAKRAVVIGASFIGLEVAASLRARGLEVTVVAPESRPLERVLGAELGDAIRAIHEQHGVTFRLGQVPTAVEREHVVISSGERLPADLVVAGVGVRPNVALAEAAGLATERGVLVNEFLETSAPGIFAAGDIARWPDPHTGERIRVEHWVVAERQAQTAARNMIAGAAGRERFDAVPFFWSAHYDVTIAYVGHAQKWDEVRVDGDITANDCEVSYVAGGRVLALATIFRDQASLRAEAAMERAVSAGGRTSALARSPA